MSAEKPVIHRLKYGLSFVWTPVYVQTNAFYPPVGATKHFQEKLSIIQVWQQLYHETYDNIAASWSSGRVQDSGLGSRSSPEFNTLPVRLLVVPLSKALHAALLLSTQEQSGYLWGQICKPWRQVACERLYAPQGVEMDIQMDMECEGPMTREGTCQSLQSRALSLDVDSKQWLYFTSDFTISSGILRTFR